MWPGSAQTALLFVGVPLLIALLLIATPLHEATTPPGDDTGPVAHPAALDLVGADLPVATAPDPPSAALAAGGLKHDPVPAVIFETRRAVRTPPARPRETPAALPLLSRQRATVWSVWRAADGVPVAAAVRTADVRSRTAPWEPQSP